MRSQKQGPLGDAIDFHSGALEERLRALARADVGSVPVTATEASGGQERPPMPPMPSASLQGVPIARPVALSMVAPPPSPSAADQAVARAKVAAVEAAAEAAADTEAAAVAVAAATAATTAATSTAATWARGPEDFVVDADAVSSHISGVASGLTRTQTQTQTVVRHAKTSRDVEAAIDGSLEQEAMSKRRRMPTMGELKRHIQLTEVPKSERDAVEEDVETKALRAISARLRSNPHTMSIPEAIPVAAPLFGVEARATPPQLDTRDYYPRATAAITGSAGGVRGERVARGAGDGAAAGRPGSPFDAAVAAVAMDHAEAGASTRTDTRGGAAVAGSSPRDYRGSSGGVHYGQLVRAVLPRSDVLDMDATHMADMDATHGGGSSGDGAIFDSTAASSRRQNALSSKSSKSSKGSSDRSRANTHKAGVASGAAATTARRGGSRDPSPTTGAGTRP